jgi:hypothetical protein
MSKSQESDSLASRLHELEQPVRLLVGTVPHPSEVPDEQRALLSSKLPDFEADSVRGSGQFIQEEQPSVVVDAITELDKVAR